MNLTISVDFVVKLSEFTGFDIIIIVIYSVSKRTHFISMHTMITTENATRFLLHNI